MTKFASANAEFSQTVLDSEACEGGFGELVVCRNADGTVRVEGDAPKILIDPDLLANVDLGVVNVAVEFAPGCPYKLVRRRDDGTIEAERLPAFLVSREISDEDLERLRAEFERVTRDGDASRIVRLP